MKKFYLCKLCLIVFGALLAVQSAMAEDQEVWFCTTTADIFILPDGDFEDVYKRKGPFANGKYPLKRQKWLLTKVLQMALISSKSCEAPTDLRYTKTMRLSAVMDPRWYNFIQRPESWMYQGMTRQWLTACSLSALSFSKKCITNRERWSLRCL